ncbi:MAG: sigma-70 family RNA polymerase sigma factor [Kiritimatiellae bacterium]|nr:sigma-70 family RNA polymerase sigma factor [Kiritimatiellia bacterium]
MTGGGGEFEELVKQTHVEIRVAIGAMGVPERDVDDVAQDVYVEYYRNMEKRPDTVSPPRWLKGIARNLCNSYFRKHGRRRDLFAAHVVDVLSAYESEWAGALAGGETLDALQRCLAAIPDGNRRIVLLHYQDELRSEEIAERVKMHAGAVRKTLSKARLALKACIERIVKG